MSALLGMRRATLQRRIRLLLGATIAYNVIEAVVALAEGTRVSSAALIGFGLDSVVEICSAAAVAWQFCATDPETQETLALRFIAMSFFVLAGYVAADAGGIHYSGNRPSSCFVYHMGVVGPSEVCITSSTRNFTGR